MESNEAICILRNVNITGQDLHFIRRQAANLIEQLQRERDEARDRLAEAERNAEKWGKDAVLMCGLAEILSEHGLIPSSSELLEARDRALAKSRDAGFRAGIEAAANRMWDIGCDETHVDDIRSLSPSDKPATPSVAEVYEEALQRIVQWSEAYPLGTFPEPDFKKARKVMEDSGMSLDAISASNMRHVTKGVGEIARRALAAREGE